ncbi:MAG: dihydrolipoyl dehydrogenase family protein [Sphingomonadales bacterium]
MPQLIKADICVIGGGSGGLSVAAGAAQMGARTVLIEKAKMGGDCLNYGCVPSKALLAAAKQAKTMASGSKFGIKDAEATVDFAKVHDHVHGVIGAIAPNDSVERFTGLGVKVIEEAARFAGPGKVEAGDYLVTARRFVIATGSSPAVPPIPGLDQVPFLTNETIFDNKQLPRHLVVIGGGPIGMELAQAHRRLGAEVTVLEKFSFFAKDDPELAQTVVESMRREGTRLMDGADISSVEQQGADVLVTIEHDGKKETIVGSHLLIATGRKPNVDGLGLEAASIRHSRSGIAVDSRLRTSNKKVFAIGDVAGGMQFTHVAAFHAGVVIKNALFRLPAKTTGAVIPWVTYTDPELSHVGMTEDMARKAHGDIRVLRWPFAENDRAQTEREAEGMVKIMTTRRGHILGASIVGKNAGELILPWVLAISQKLKIGAMASMIAPYPTQGEAAKRAAGSYYTPSLFSPKTRRLVRFLARFG